MKKILSLLGSLSLTAGSVITVISCTPGTEVNDPQEMSEGFSKILAMNEEQRTELLQSSRKWLNEFMSNDTNADNVRELINGTVETYPEGISEELFNNEILYYWLASSTVTALNEAKDDTIIIDYEQMDNFDIFLNNKFVNAENQLWAKEIKEYYADWHKRIGFQKISKMSQEQKDNWKEALDLWFEDNQELIIVKVSNEVLNKQLNKLPEQLTENQFNNAFLLYKLTQITINVMNEMQSETKEVNPIYAITFENILKNKFTNSKNKIWVENIKTWIEAQKKSN